MTAMNATTTAERTGGYPKRPGEIRRDPKRPGWTRIDPKKPEETRRNPKKPPEVISKRNGLWQKKGNLT
jgi:hypothetical protein